MRIIKSNQISNKLAALIDGALCNIEKSVCNIIDNLSEDNPFADWALKQIRENNALAAATHSYACQDCGLAVLFVNIGRDVFIEGDITAALNLGVQIGYKDARKSVAHPLTRINTKTNIPAVIYYDFVEGDKLEIIYLAKGAGSENMSAVHMLTPAAGRQGIIDAVINSVKSAGANPCPPIILGIGIGGTMDKCALLSKLALTRETGAPSPDEETAKLEREILCAVNKTGIGVQGLGGKNTCLATHIECFPTHIGMLPVAVNIQCHSVRHGKIIL